MYAQHTGTLKHIPVVVIEDYEHIDGCYAYVTGVEALSLGLAQWGGLLKEMGFVR